MSRGWLAMRCFRVTPVQKLHGDEGLVSVLADFVNGADIGMVEGRGSTSLAAKAFQRLRVLRHIVGQEFESNEATEVSVLGLVNNTHPAAAQFLDDAVVRDGLADQPRDGLQSSGRNVRVAAQASQRTLSENINSPEYLISESLTGPKFHCLDKRCSWFHLGSYPLGRMGKLQFLRVARTRTERCWLLTMVRTAITH
jgi:hypothetical protein